MVARWKQYAMVAGGLLVFFLLMYLIMLHAIAT